MAKTIGERELALRAMREAKYEAAQKTVEKKKPALRKPKKSGKA